VTEIVRLPGLVPYAQAHTLQKQILEARIAGEAPDTVLVLEHAPVVTLGRRRTSLANVGDVGDWPVVQAERGGDVTWHGPGQLVVYPIVKLEGDRADLHRFMASLEQAVIDLCDDLGVSAGRDDRNTGVWIAGRKVCSIGIACRRGVTWHGLALNVDNDPSVWERIRPCGFDPDIMTRLADHAAGVTVDDVAERLVPRLLDSLGLSRT
jgi:lipoyl(octanoyl) transferase